MKSFRITFFVTAVILFSMILGSLSAHAQVPYSLCAADTKKLYMDIQVYNQTFKISNSNAIIGKHLKQDINTLNMPGATIQEKVHQIETSFARCYVDLSADDELEIQMTVEMFKKGTHPSASEE